MGGVLPAPSTHDYNARRVFSRPISTREAACVGLAMHKHDNSSAAIRGKATIHLGPAAFAIACRLSANFYETSVPHLPRHLRIQILLYFFLFLVFYFFYPRQTCTRPLSLYHDHFHRAAASTRCCLTAAGGGRILLGHPRHGQNVKLVLFFTEWYEASGARSGGAAFA